MLFVAKFSISRSSSSSSNNNNSNLIHICSPSGFDGLPLEWEQQLMSTPLLICLISVVNDAAHAGLAAFPARIFSLIRRKLSQFWSWPTTTWCEGGGGCVGGGGGGVGEKEVKLLYEHNAVLLLPELIAIRFQRSSREKRPSPMRLLKPMLMMTLVPVFVPQLRPSCTLPRAASPLPLQALVRNAAPMQPRPAPP